MHFSLLFSLDHHKGVSPVYPQLLSQLYPQIIKAERGGFSGVWFTENHLSPADGLCPDPPLLIAFAAGITTKLRLGSAVSVAPLHKPLFLAEQYAFLDNLSQGRIDIGIGSGFFESVFDAFGVTFGDRQDLRDSAIKDMVKYFKLHSESQSTLEGGLGVLPSIQKPHPPIWIAAVALDRVYAILSEGFSVLIDPVFAWFDMDDLSNEIKRARRDGHLNGKVGLLLYSLIGKSEDAFIYFERYLGKALSNKNKSASVRDHWRVRQDSGTILCCTSDVAVTRISHFANIGVDQILLGVGFGGIESAASLNTLDIFSSEILPKFAT